MNADAALFPIIAQQMHIASMQNCISNMMFKFDFVLWRVGGGRGGHCTE